AVHFDAIRVAWDRAADVITTNNAGIPDRVFPRPALSDGERREQELRLTATEWAQPAIVTASLGMLRLIERLGVRARCVGGHSLGELTALAAAGVLDDATLLAAARRRGELMASASEIAGAMTAVVASRAMVEERIARWKSDVVV